VVIDLFLVVVGGMTMKMGPVLVTHKLALGNLRMPLTQVHLG